MSVSQDAGSFYSFFALMTFGGFGLISHDRSLPAQTAGRAYISLAILGEMSILSGLILASHEAGSFEIQAIVEAMGVSPFRDVFSALIFLGFGVKVGLVPLHLWLPVSYSAAPVPAAAVLSGAMTKAGVLGWIRFLPIGLMFSEGWSLVLIASGVLMAFYGVFVGLAQTQVKTSLAYSSLSQMGYLTIAVGAAVEPGADVLRSLAACLAYAVHHGTTKAALFLGLTVVAATERSSHLRKLVLFLLLVSGLSLVGVPLSGGAYAKAILKEAGSRVGAWHELSGVLMTAGSAATALLVARIMVLFARMPKERSAMTTRLILPWILLVLFSTFSQILIPVMLSALDPTFSDEHLVKAPSGTALTIAIILALLVLFWSICARESDRPSIPPGDLLIPVSRALRRLKAETENISRHYWERFTSWRQETSVRVIRRGAVAFLEFEKLRTRGFAGIGLLLIVWAAFWLLLVGGDA